MKINISLLFIFLAFVSLLASVFFGCLAALQYVSATALDGILSFQMMRPLHVSMVISWIFSSALAGVYYYLPKIVKQEIFSDKLVCLHFISFVLTGLVILYSYFTKSFGGREYWAFPTYLSIPIIISWLFLIINFFSTLLKYLLSFVSGKTDLNKIIIPVYIWMWAVGIVFFFFTFIESYLWMVPYFRENIVRDIMVQWKSYGSLIGSWNLLVYGTAIYVMDKISGKNGSTGKMAYFLFFLGVSNLILGWSHHIYILPTEKWIRYVGYAISMTELFILALMIWKWKKTIKFPEKGKYYLIYLFFVSADLWIILNLVLAIIISIPALNIYTHGTHITVAHAMGSTIGINTMILLASIFYILYDCKVISEKDRNLKFVRKGFWIMNVSLLIFWINLIGIGILKSYYSFQDLHHQQIMSLLSPYFVGFLIFGIGIFIGVLLIVLPILKKKNFILLS